jgi:hypothetical protein
LTAEGDDGQNSTKDAIINVILSRKSQLYRQRASVIEANEEAEKVNLVSLSKTQIKLKYPTPLEKTVEQQD